MEEIFRHTESDNKSGGNPDAGTLALPPWEGPAIILVDLDAFFASVEQLDHPAWKGKPVIVGGDADKRGVVSTASYEARTYGVRSAMASSTARRLCPDAIWTHGNHRRYKEMSSKVMDILYAESPHVQQVSIDEAFVDISPTPHNTEHPVQIAQRIQTRVDKLGITCSIGLGTSKTIAKIASDMDKPRGLTIVYPGRERAFLAPLPVRTLSGIGESTEKELHRHNIQTLGDLARTDESFLQRVFGKHGTTMHIRANGKDDAPVEADDSVKSVSNEITFASDLTTQDEIESALSSIGAKVGRRLRMKGLKGHTLSVKVRFGDRSVKSVQRQLAEPSDDDLAFIPMLYQMITEIWRPGMPVMLLGVGMSGFAEQPLAQEQLFDPDDLIPDEQKTEPLVKDADKRSELLKATDSVKARFGEGSLQFGHEMHTQRLTTGSGSKNPADYK